MHNAISPQRKAPRLRGAISICFRSRLPADAPRSVHHMSTRRSDARTNHTAAFVGVIAVVIRIGVIAVAAIIVVARKAGTDADADGAKLHTGTAAVSTDKDLRAGRGRNAESGGRRHNEKKFFHVTLQIRFGLSSGGSTRGAPALFAALKDISRDRQS